MIICKINETEHIYKNDEVPRQFFSFLGFFGLVFVVGFFVLGFCFVFCVKIWIY